MKKRPSLPRTQTVTMAMRSKTMAQRLQAFLVPQSGHHEMYLGLTETTQT